MKNFLKKLQNQPKHVRKLILWIVVIALGLVLAIWWIHSSYWKLKKIQTEEIIKEQWIKELKQQLE